MEVPEDKPAKKQPERPLECSECKKAITVIYTEIAGDMITQTSMCSDCPELQRRLHGTQNAQQIGEKEELSTGVACGNCSTPLEAVKMGSLLGCPVCYEVFEEAVLTELRDEEKLPQRVMTHARSVPIHIGRSPGELLEITPSIRLLALNEALNDTLKKEDYEQAAILRDQIKELTESENKNEPR